jgi:hypothetical protein
MRIFSSEESSFYQKLYDLDGKHWKSLNCELLVNSNKTGPNPQDDFVDSPLLGVFMFNLSSARIIS